MSQKAWSILSADDSRVDNAEPLVCFDTLGLVRGWPEGERGWLDC